MSSSSNVPGSNETPSLAGIPCELFKELTKYLSSKDLANLRFTCLALRDTAAVYMCKRLILSLTEESLKIERVSKHGLLSQGVHVLNTDTTFYEGHLSVPTVSYGEDILAELENELDFQFWAGKYVWEKLKGVAKKKCSLEELKELAVCVHFDSARVEELRSKDCHKLYM